MTEHKNNRDPRTKNLTDARASAEALEGRLAIVEAEYAAITKESQSLDAMLLQLMKAIQPAIKAQAEAIKVDTELNKTLRLPEMTFLNPSTTGFTETIQAD
jgi:septum formation topological specificity factor MinE